MDTILTVRCDIAGCWGSAVAENDAELEFLHLLCSLPEFLPVLVITGPGIAAHVKLQSLASRTMACVAA